MRRSHVVALVVAAGCGRVDFASFDAPDTNDDAQTGDASTLVVCPVSTTAPPTVTITGITFHYLSFDNRTTPVPTTTVTALHGVTGSALAQVTSDANGNYAITIPTGGQPTPVVLELSPGGTYYTTYEILDLPLDADLTAPPLTMNDVFSPADAPVWDLIGMQQIYGQVMLKIDNARGNLNVAVRDCADAPVTGVTVELDPPSELLRYQAADGTASETRTSTGGPFAHALAFNSPAGPTRIIARKDGVVVADQVVEVRSGTAYTLAVVRAPGV